MLSRKESNEKKRNYYINISKNSFLLFKVQSNSLYIFFCIHLFSEMFLNVINLKLLFELMHSINLNFRYRSERFICYQILVYVVN